MATQKHTPTPTHPERLIASGGPVSHALRTMRSDDPELRALRATAERMIADSRAARLRAIMSLRRANSALRSARATLAMGVGR